MTEIWSQGTYARIADWFAPLHAELVARLAPAAGERWLDVATGHGGVALEAARAGAEVTGLDLSETMLGHARANAAAAGLDIRFDQGDAQALPYEDDSFDVVSSSFGAVFPPDRAAVARELARVVRPGGRLGMTAWQDRPRYSAIYERVSGEAGEYDHTEWGREEVARGLLGADFELDIVQRDLVFEAPSPEAATDFMIESAPPTRVFFDRLDDEQRHRFRDELGAYFRDFETPEGVREPRPYVVILGTRR